MIGRDNPLRVGQTVGVEDLDPGFRITVLGPSQPGLSVVAAEPDFVVLADGATGGSLRIPMYLVKAVISQGGEASEAA